jgi:hypothetical protein
MTRHQESAWKRYLSLFSPDMSLESIPYGDLRLLSLSEEWKEKINKAGKLTNSSLTIPHLDENNAMILSECFDQMTKLMTVQAMAQKEKAMRVFSKLKNAIKLSLQDSQYQFIDLHLLGSTMNYLAFDTSSDLDFALMVETGSQPLQLQKLFDHMGPLLTSNGFKITEYVLHARVPILCLQDTDSDLEVSTPVIPLFSSSQLLQSRRLIFVSITQQVLKIQN